MRSSKSRSRSKQNRPRTLGNIINRVFDSSGPEGKVRGTPQQIIEKYQLLARDAQLSNDRVAAENFLQHAEHYTRLLAEAQREMAAEQEARQQFHQQNQQRDRQGGNGNGDWRGEREPRGDEGEGNGPAAFDVIGEEEGSLVDLPEFIRPPRREFRDDRQRDDRPRDDRPRDERPRDDRPRDDRPREDRPREDRPRGEHRGERGDRSERGDRGERRPREDRRPEAPREAEAQPTPAAAPEPVIDATVPVARAPRPPRAPRKPKPEGEAG